MLPALSLVVMCSEVRDYDLRSCLKGHYPYFREDATKSILPTLGSNTPMVQIIEP